MRRTFALARTAADRGDRPFGSVLVRANEIVTEESNRLNTAEHLRRHPELHLAYRAGRGLDPDEQARAAAVGRAERWEEGEAIAHVVDFEDRSWIRE